MVVLLQIPLMIWLLWALRSMNAIMKNTIDISASIVFCYMGNPISLLACWQGVCKKNSVPMFLLLKEQVLWRRNAQICVPAAHRLSSFHAHVSCRLVLGSYCYLKGHRAWILSHKKILFWIYLPILHTGWITNYTNTTIWLDEVINNN